MRFYFANFVDLMPLLKGTPGFPLGMAFGSPVAYFKLFLEQFFHPHLPGDGRMLFLECVMGAP